MKTILARAFQEARNYEKKNIRVQCQNFDGMVQDSLPLVLQKMPVPKLAEFLRAFADEWHLPKTHHGDAAGKFDRVVCQVVAYKASKKSLLSYSLAWQPTMSVQKPMFVIEGPTQIMGELCTALFSGWKSLGEAEDDYYWMTNV